MSADAARPWIVAVTANAMSGDADRCLAAGMIDYISKPISMDELRPVTAPWLDGATGLPHAKAS